MSNINTQASIDEEASTSGDEHYGDSAEHPPSKRPRGQGLSARAAAPPMPQDVCNAMILLRVSKEHDFIKSSNGRTRNMAGVLWSSISEELAREFLPRRDVASSTLHPRALGKKWSYVEKHFKVCILQVLFSELAFVTIARAEIPCSTEAQRR
jgi:hypothetical protein